MDGLQGGETQRRSRTVREHGRMVVADIRVVKILSQDGGGGQARGEAGFPVVAACTRGCASGVAWPCWIRGPAPRERRGSSESAGPKASRLRRERCPTEGRFTQVRAQLQDLVGRAGIAGPASRQRRGSSVSCMALTSRAFGARWWAVQESNLRLRPCDDRTLPTELTARPLRAAETSQPPRRRQARATRRAPARDRRRRARCCGPQRSGRRRAGRR